MTNFMDQLKAHHGYLLDSMVENAITELGADYPLECNQNYNDLDLDCNSLFDGSLIHLNRKPGNLQKNSIDFNRVYEIYTRENCITQ